MIAAIPDLNVTISHKRWACVLDPMLALSVHGVPLLTRLGAVLEMWVVRELWHILDNTHFYLERPEILLSAGGNDGQTERTWAIVQALREWEHIRLENDPSRQYCYWIGDGPLESFLPEGMEPEIVWRYEALSGTLDRRLANPTAPLVSACRDAAALAVCLPFAVVLTQLVSVGAGAHSPIICQMLEGGGIPCKEVPAEDAWRKKESDWLREVLTQAGLSKWMWSGLRLAVLHLAAPTAFMAGGKERRDVDFLAHQEWGDMENSMEHPEMDYWREARGFWYPL